jgi:hypothetical protein
MNILNSIAVAGALVLLAGCASSPQLVTLAPIGPAPNTAPAKTGPDGWLQVYSAKQAIPLQMEGGQWWRWDTPYAPKTLPRSSAHTGYIVRTAEGRSIRFIRNARNETDSTPTLVALPPGHYQVEARAEESDGHIVRVVLPVVIESGRTTIAHLSGSWKPHTQYADAQVVRLPDGEIAGWLAAR